MFLTEVFGWLEQLFTVAMGMIFIPESAIDFLPGVCPCGDEFLAALNWGRGNGSIGSTRILWVARRSEPEKWYGWELERLPLAGGVYASAGDDHQFVATRPMDARDIFPNPSFVGVDLQKFVVGLYREVLSFHPENGEGENDDNGNYGHLSLSLRPKAPTAPTADEVAAIVAAGVGYGDAPSPEFVRVDTPDGDGWRYTTQSRRQILWAGGRVYTRGMKASLTFLGTVEGICCGSIAQAAEPDWVAGVFPQLSR
jgi:hypothetical protein